MGGGPLAALKKKPMKNRRYPILPSAQPVSV